jgi:predicted alpha/beta-hydrolase family hydrolase
MTKRHVCFSHGQESGPWGSKIRSLADVAAGQGWPVESIDYQGIADPMARVRVLVEWCQKQPVAPVLAGSSMGAFVSVAASAQAEVAGLFLLAPALYVPGYRENLPAVAPGCPITIVHGWADTVVPWEDSVQYAAAHHARLLLVDGDHRLAANIGEIGRLFSLFLDELGSPGPEEK